MKNRFHTPRSFWFVALGAAASMAACGDDKTSFTDAGGSGGNSGWTYVPPGTNVGGSGGTTGVAGSGNGGTLAHAGSAGSAGSGGSGGSAMLPPVTFKCGGQKPDQPIITSFDAFMADRWSSPGNLDGGVYVYPDPLKPTAGDFLRFADQVKDFTGMGVWFSGCIDGSKFRGVRFSIAGKVGMTGTVQFYAITNRDKDVNETDSVGSCVPADPNDTWQSCRPPVVTLPVTEQTTTHSIAWSAFKDGLPSVTSDGSDVIALQWSFDWEAGTAPYAAELTVDNLEFFTDDPSGDGGAGGMPSTVEPQGGAPATPGSGGQAGN